jgi:uncharacterized protein
MIGVHAFSMLKMLGSWFLCVSILLGKAFSFLTKPSWVDPSLQEVPGRLLERSLPQEPQKWAEASPLSRPLEAFLHLKRAALRGDMKAMRELVVLFEQGDPLPEDSEEVLRDARMLAESGDPETQCGLGLSLMLGAPQDFDEGLKWLTLAAEQGLLQAQVALAGFFWTGFGPLARDQEKAMNWYEQAAFGGHRVGKRMLGLAYRDGSGRSANISLALEWLTRAASSGDAKSALYIGEIYLKGLGVPSNAACAFSWLRQAAEAGEEKAQFLVAMQLLEGKGVKQHTLAGISYLFRAASQGLSEAQYVLGAMYAEGSHVALDEVEGKKWLKLAAEQGHKAADLFLDWLEYGVVVEVMPR